MRVSNSSSDETAIGSQFCCVVLLTGGFTSCPAIRVDDAAGSREEASLGDGQGGGDGQGSGDRQGGGGVLISSGSD